MNLSIVIPVCNSEKILPELLNKISKEVIFSELCFINDCSADQSWKIIQELSENNPRVTGINLRKNCGQDNAILAGLRSVHGDVVIVMDDDLQHDPSHIMSLVKNLVEKDLDVCFAKFTNNKQKTWKKIGSYINGRIASILLNYHKDIYLSPFKAISGNLARDLAKMEVSKPYIDAMIVNLTARLGNIEIPHCERFEGKSNYNLYRSIKVFSKMFFSYSYFPIRIIHGFGMIYFISSLILATYYLVRWVQQEPLPEGWMTLLVLNLASASITLLSIALVSEYIGRIFITQNGYIPYSIKDTCNFKN